MVLSWFRSTPKPASETESATAPSPLSSQPTEPQSQTQQTLKTSSPGPELPKLWTPQTNTKLFFGGALFFALSLITTRRAFIRRFKATIPPYYTSSVHHKPEVNGGLEAFEALHLATINVLSFGMMASGGVLWAMGINGLEDMRAYVKKGMAAGNPVEGSKTDEEMEKEVEAWVIKYLGKRIEDGKLKDLEKGGKEGKST